MSAVGIVSILVGILVICGRAPLMIVPAAFLGWFNRLIESDSNLRILGVISLLLAAVMIWAGGTGHGTLSDVLTIWGWAIVAVATPWLILFPAVYRGIASAFLPLEEEDSLPGWRLVGGLGTFIGLLLIYSGVLAL